MLVNLNINNFLLIQSANIEVGKGLCVLTGETGAGKSILLESLKFVLGKKSSKELVRPNNKQAIVCAEFLTEGNRELSTILEENAIEISKYINIRRVLYLDGRTKCFINDIPIGLSVLKTIGDTLIEFHGQHDQHNLLDSSFHRSLIDQYAGLEEELTYLKENYHQYSGAKKSLEETKEKITKSRTEQDYLEHIVAELELLDPKIHEEEELVSKRTFLSSKEKIAKSLEAALSELNGANKIEKSLNAAEKYLSRLPEESIETLGISQALKSLESASIEISEAVSQIESAMQGLENTSELEHIEDRLFKLREAARKFRCHPDELVEFFTNAKDKLSFIQNSTESIKTLQGQVEATKEQYYNKAKAISEKRKKAAQEIEEKILKELAPLKMEKTRFKAEFTELEEERWSDAGIDKVIFLASSNPGSPLKPIARIASGGELSRFMLSLKVVLTNTSQTPVMIFDEIDTGVSGAVSDAIGKRLYKLGQLAQIIVVTHQPQIAAKGNHHFLVYKKHTSTSTDTNIIEIQGIERTKEIARMIAGEELTDEAQAAAQKLLENI